MSNDTARIRPNFWEYIGVTIRNPVSSVLAYSSFSTVTEGARSRAIAT